MKDETSVILGSQLQKARQTIQFTIEDASKYLQLPPKEIIAWEEDRDRPGLKELERLAEIYGREIDFFLKETPDMPGQIEFRSAARQSIRELSEDARKVIARFDELCRTFYEIQKERGKIKQPEVQRVTESRSPSDLARDQRYFLGFDNKPANKLRDRLDQKGVQIFELPVPNGEFSGFSYWHENYGPCILINAKDVPGRRNFTLAHEYAHLLYGHAPSVCEISEENKTTSIIKEPIANYFAIEFLMPSEPITEDFSKRELSQKPTPQEIERMAGKWHVSVQAMSYRLEELDLIKKGYANYLLSTYKPTVPRFGAPKMPKWERSLGKVFVSNVLDAYREGHISLGKLASCLCVPLRKALEIAEK